MAKKLILLAAAVAALAAMAIPATASAHFTLKDDVNGVPTKVEPGSWIVGTSTNTLTTNTAFGAPLECPHINVVAQLLVNSGKEITAGNAVVGDPTNCKVAGQDLTITEPTLTHLVTKGEDKGIASLSFVADAGPFECPYGGEVPFTYNTGTNNDTLTLHGTLTSPFSFCEGEEAATFEGTYTLTTTDKTPVFVVAENT